MIIDSHLHLFGGIGEGGLGKYYFPRRQHQIVNWGWAYGGNPPYTRDPETLMKRGEGRFSDPSGRYNIETMDEAGVDASIVLPIDYGISHEEEPEMTMEEKYEHIAGLEKKFPGRFYGFGGCDPRRPGAAELFKRGVKDYGFHGLKVIPHSGYFPNDARLFPMYETCLKYDLPVFICTGGTAGIYDRGLRFSSPLYVNDVACCFPDLKIVLLHTGFPLPNNYEESMLVAGIGAHNIYLGFDWWLFPAKGWRGFGLGTSDLLGNEKQQEEAVKLVSLAKERVGAHRLLWGTDSMQGPAFHGPTSCFHAGMKNVVETLKNLPEIAAKYGYSWTKEEVDLFLGENAARLLKIKPIPPGWETKPYGWQRSRLETGE